jgi:hypothetical protein
MRRADYKTASSDLMRKIAAALGVPPDHFPEYRQIRVIERIKADPTLRDDLYSRFVHGRPTGRGTSRS